MQFFNAKYYILHKLGSDRDVHSVNMEETLKNDRRLRGSKDSKKIWSLAYADDVILIAKIYRERRKVKYRGSTEK